MKNNTVFECTECGAQYSKWQGRCSDCGNWNTLIEVTASLQQKDSKPSAIKTFKFNEVVTENISKFKTDINEFDRVLGGGFVLGQVILLAGEPGIGKSTLILQIAKNYKKSIYYICGEESPFQVKQRAERLGVDKNSIVFIENTDIETINSYLSNIHDGLIIVDSINSVFSSKYKSYAGSISNVRECSQVLTSTAKKNNLNLIIVGQINKEGDIAGPKTLEHIVDTVLILEGDSNYAFRVLRCSKNRYGSVNETGIFLMDEKGMTPIPNPSKYLLLGRIKNASGSSVCIVSEGTRCFAVEIQALCVKSNFGFPKRVASGFSSNRLNLLCAIIEKHLNFNLSSCDIYLNVASGINIKEPASDLAVCAAIVSSFKEKSLKSKSCFFGEVGLNGEVRPVTMTKMRLKEAENMEFTNTYYSSKIKTLADLYKEGVGGSKVTLNH